MHQDSRERDIQVPEAPKLVGELSGLPPSEVPSGPRRKAPRYYAGETYGDRRIQHADVERNRNGSLPGIRNKAARRIIRGAFKRKLSHVEQALQLPRAMQAQAREIVSEYSAVEDRNGTRAWKGKSTRAARRLFAQELAIHVPVYVPDQKTLRAMRTAKRKLKRAGKTDAIGQLVDRMAAKP